ncbi:hypothetical protein OS31_37060 [Dickeya oryzae]
MPVPVKNKSRSPHQMKTVRYWLPTSALRRKKSGEVKPSADNNWRLAKIVSDTPLDIRVETSPSPKAAAFIKEKSQYPLTLVGNDDIGFAVYRLDLQH